MAEVGVTIAQLAEQLGASKSTVRRAARRAGVELVPGQVTRLDADQASAVAALVGRRGDGAGAPRSDADAVRDAPGDAELTRMAVELAVAQERVRGLERQLDQAQDEIAHLRGMLDAEQARPRTLWDRLFGRRALPAPDDRG